MRQRPRTHAHLIVVVCALVCAGAFPSIATAASAPSPSHSLTAVAPAFSVGDTGSGGDFNIDFWQVSLVGGDQVEIGVPSSTTCGNDYHFELYPWSPTNESSSFYSAAPLSKVHAAACGASVTLWAPYTGTFLLAVCQDGAGGFGISDCRGAYPASGPPQTGTVDPMDQYTVTTVLGPGSPTLAQAATETQPFPTISGAVAEANTAGNLQIPGFDAGGGHNIDFWQVHLVGGDQVEIGLSRSPGAGNYHFELYPSGTTDGTNFDSAPPLSKVVAGSSEGTNVTLWAPYTGTFILAVCEDGAGGFGISDCRGADPAVGNPQNGTVDPMDPYTITTVLGPGSPTLAQAAAETQPFPTISGAVAEANTAGNLQIPGFDAGGGHNVDFWEVQLVGGEQVEIGLSRSPGAGNYHFELYPSGTTDGTSFDSAPPLSEVIAGSSTGPNVTLPAPSYTGTFILAVCEDGAGGFGISDCRGADPAVGNPQNGTVDPMDPYTFTTTSATSATSAPDPTATEVSCLPASLLVGGVTSCTATVSDTASSGASNPTGTVSFTSSPTTGAFGSTGSCTLQASGTPGTASCSVAFTPAAAGAYTISGDYNGDSGHATSSGQSSVTATSIPPPQERLTVSLTGSGTGSVTGGGIDCPGTCSTSASQGSTITLSAKPASKSKFAGWSGDGCSGTGTCKVTLTGDESVSATFTASPPSGRSGPPSPAKVKAALSKILKPSGKTAKLKAILKSDGYSFSFSAPSAGELVIRWYATVKGKRLLVASVGVVFHAARKATVKLRLTRKGLDLLKTTRTLKLTTEASFTPTGGTTTSQTKTTTLRR